MSYLLIYLVLLFNEYNIRLHVNSVLIEELKHDNMQLKRNVEELKDTCNNIFSFMQSCLGNYTPTLQQGIPLKK